MVWAVGQKAALLSVGASRARRVPLVWHKVDFTRDASVAKPLAALSDGVIAVSEAAAEALGPLRGARLLGVVYPPLRTSPPSGSHAAPSTPAIGTLARFVPYKGLHHIVEAAGLLAERWPQLRVVLAGQHDGKHADYPERLRELALRVGLEDRLELSGFTHDVAGTLAGLTVFVNATYRDASGAGLEGISGAMLEAASAGLPVVATAGGGTPEGMLDGVTGVIVDSADPQSLAAAIAPYLEDPELARRTGQAGRRFVEERFAASQQAAQLFSLLADAARTRREWISSSRRRT
jgi:glycosyltransferase involved in cell wall biosynthesis